VHLKGAKGSNVAPKVKYGVAWGMYREQVVFKSPFHSQTFRSKSFVGFASHSRANYLQLLGLPHSNNRKSLPMPGDDALKINVHLKAPEEAQVWPRIPIVGIKVATEDGGAASKDGSQQDLGGSVQVFDVDGEQLLLDRDSGVLHRTGDTSHERVPLAASWPPAAGSRAGDRGGKRALDSAAENSAGLSLDGTASTEVTQ